MSAFPLNERSHWGYRRKNGFRLMKGDSEKLTATKQTVPDQALSVQELFRRWRDGLPLGVNSFPNYGDEDDENFDAPDMEKLQQMDIVERVEVVQDIENRATRARRKKKEAESLPGPAQEREPGKPGQVVSPDKNDASVKAS